MNIAVVVTYAENYEPLAKITLPNIEKYCRFHNYDFRPHKIKGEWKSDSGFQKLEYIHNIFRNNHAQTVWCIDLDVMITNYSIRIEKFLDGDHDMHITKDVNGVNAGSFIIGNTRWAKEFLRALHNPEFPNEQVAIEKLMRKHDPDGLHIRILPHPSINSYPYEMYAPTYGKIGGEVIAKPTHKQGNWESGDFCLHLPGMPLEKRIEFFTELNKQVS